MPSRSSRSRTATAVPRARTSLGPRPIMECGEKLGFSGFDAFADPRLQISQAMFQFSVEPLADPHLHIRQRLSEFSIHELLGSLVYSTREGPRRIRARNASQLEVRA